jgi:hypothetical protein
MIQFKSKQCYQWLVVALLAIPVAMAVLLQLTILKPDVPDKLED